MAQSHQKSKRLLDVVSAGETATGLALLMFPSQAFHLLFGGVLSGDGDIIGRFAGITLISLGVACWLGKPLIGLLIYSSAVALYLLMIGLGGHWTGILLWPVVLLHVVLSSVLTKFLMAWD
ncbi:MAG: hypothetical protein WBM08_08040 [Prochlorococcaceae cyanobacterium]